MVLTLACLVITNFAPNCNDDSGDSDSRERRMQPARGRFARFDLDRQMASTPLECGPSSRFLGQPATGTRRVAGTTHTQSGRR